MFREILGNTRMSNGTGDTGRTGLYEDIQGDIGKYGVVQTMHEGDLKMYRELLVNTGLSKRSM